MVLLDGAKLQRSRQNAKQLSEKRDFLTPKYRFSDTKRVFWTLSFVFFPYLCCVNSEIHRVS